MSSHNLFYFPYASFTDEQLPLLKTAALYFDKLYILDPVEASWDRVGSPYWLRDATKLLVDAGILETISPADVLSQFEDAIMQAIREDLVSKEFLKLCSDRDSTWRMASSKIPKEMFDDPAYLRQTGGNWSLALAKIPSDLKKDNIMQDLLRNMSDKVAEDRLSFTERVIPPRSEFENVVPVYDEYREGYGDEQVEYRYVNYPLPVGESIMLNHALFGGILHLGATPLTDHPFHSKALNIKLKHAINNPTIREAIERRVGPQKTKENIIGFKTLTDAQLDLPVLNPELPLQEILEFRQKNEDALHQARDRLGWMARRVKSEPWSEDFMDHLKHEVIPDINDKLDEARKARDGWLKTERKRHVLKGAGIVVGAATAGLTVLTAPMTPVAIASAGLALAAGSVIPGAEWLLDWQEGKKAAEENGLHYLLMT